MRSTLLGVATAVFLSTLVIVYGQQDKGNPFQDHSDTGETIHVLPGPAAIHSPRDTQPSFAPRTGLAVYPPSYGSGDLIDHGGKVMNSPGFYAIYWNSSVAASTGSQGHTYLQTQIAAFAGTFLNSLADYSIVSQYAVRGNDPTPGSGFAGDKVDIQLTKNSIKDSAIRSYLAGLFNSGTVPMNSNTIYGVYFPSGMKVMLTGGTSCSSFCGYHSHFTYNGTQIKYAVFPYTDCSACKLSSLAVADMLTIVTSHEIREAATDPGDSNINAWYDKVGYEADDKCAWHNLYQLNRGAGLQFFVQPEYSNNHHGCVVP